jgi:hypothetical protein
MIWRARLIASCFVSVWGTSTSQGPRTVFKRALERGNLPVAEATAKEIGRISLAEALELTALVAEKTPERHGRFAARWLSCYLDELEPETLEEVGFVLGCLAALAGDERELALMSLRAVVKGRVRRGCG